MKKAGTEIDFKKDKAEVLGQNQDLIITTAGHYATQLGDKEDNRDKEQEEINSCILISGYLSLKHFQKFLVTTVVNLVMKTIMKCVNH